MTNLQEVDGLVIFPILGNKASIYKMFGSRHFQALKNNEIAVLSHHQIIGSASVSFPMNKKRWKLLIHR